MVKVQNDKVKRKKRVHKIEKKRQERNRKRCKTVKRF